MNLNDLNDALSGGTRWALGKTTPVGVEQGGRILSAEVKQVRNFDTGKPECWDDDPAQPMKEVVITVQTNEREDGTDNGERAFHVKTWGEGARALKAAVREAGASTPAEALKPGNEFYGKKTGEEQVAGKKFSKNLLEFRIVRNAGAGLDEALGANDAQEAAAEGFRDPAPKARVPLDAAPAAAPALDPGVAKKIRAMLDNDFDRSMIRDTLGVTDAQIDSL